MPSPFFLRETGNLCRSFDREGALQAVAAASAAAAVPFGAFPGGVCPLSAPLVYTDANRAVPQSPWPVFAPSSSDDDAINPVPFAFAVPYAPPTIPATPQSNERTHERPAPFLVPYEWRDGRPKLTRVPHQARPVRPWTEALHLTARAHWGDDDRFSPRVLTYRARTAREPDPVSARLRLALRSRGALETRLQELWRDIDRT